MPYIILDRDGVINFDSPDYIKSPDEWRAIPGSPEAIAQLNRAGFKVLVVTNQAGVARGYFDLATLDLIHEKMMHELAAVGGYIEEIVFCIHHPDENCLCRKPKPGMLHQIEKKYPVKMNETYFIGDSAKDIFAAQAAGCLPILVHTGNGALAMEHHPEFAAIPNFRNLKEAVEFVLRRKNA